MLISARLSRHLLLMLGMVASCQSATEDQHESLSERAKPVLDCGTMATFTVTGSHYAFSEGNDQLEAMDRLLQVAVEWNALGQFSCEECPPEEKGCDQTFDWSHEDSTVGTSTTTDDLECVQEPVMGDPVVLIWMCKGTVVFEDAAVRAGCTACK